MDKQGHPKRLAAGVESFVTGWRSLVGGRDDTVTHLWFRVAEDSAESITDWATFWPALEASVRAEKSRRIGITLVDRTRFGMHERAHRAEHAREKAEQLKNGVERPRDIRCSRAIAYALGDAVMVAELPVRVMLPKSDDHFFFAMTVDDEPVRSTAGLWHPDEHKLFVPEKGIHAGRTVEITDDTLFMPLFT